MASTECLISYSHVPFTILHVHHNNETLLIVHAAPSNSTSGCCDGFVDKLRVMTIPLPLAIQHVTKRPGMHLWSLPQRSASWRVPQMLAVSAKESGAWFHDLLISSLGLRMDDNTVRIAVGLRLGSTLCRPHNCQHCGAEVDHLATHGLSCKNSEGRHYRHGASTT